MGTSTSLGMMMFNIFGALSEYKRSLIRERVCAGLLTAKAKGVKLDRPSKMNDGMRQAVKLLRETK
jgi:DNA invertase Pin-like site-specific DNA recombinase